MDLNSLTAIGRSWVGNVCQKVESVFQEVDAIMKQNMLDGEKGQASSRIEKNLCAEVTHEEHRPQSLPRSEDKLLDVDTNAASPNLLVHSEHRPIQVETLPLNVDEAALSLANVEERPVLGYNSLVNLVEKHERNYPEQSADEVRVPGENDSDPESTRPDALNRWDEICEFNILDCENIEDGEEAGDCQHVTSILERPAEGAESGIGPVTNSKIVDESAVNEESLTSEVKATSDSAEELSQTSKHIQVLNENDESARDSEAELSLAGSVQEMKARSINSHAETFGVTLSEPLPITCAKEKSPQMGSDSLNNPLVVQAVGNSCSSRESFVSKFGSPDIILHAEESNLDHSTLHVPSLLSATGLYILSQALQCLPYFGGINPTFSCKLGNMLHNLRHESNRNFYFNSDNSGYDLLGFDMETVELNDEVEKLEMNVDSIDSKELYALSLRVQKVRSFKNKLRDAFTPKKQLSKQYKHLGIWYGDIDIRLAGETQLVPSTSVSSMHSDSNSKNLQKRTPIESEWVLL